MDSQNNIAGIRSAYVHGRRGQPPALWGRQDFSESALQRLRRPFDSVGSLGERERQRHAASHGAARRAIAPPQQGTLGSIDELITELRTTPGLENLPRDIAKKVILGEDLGVYIGGQKSRKKCKGPRRKHSRRKHSRRKHSRHSRRKHKGTKRRRTHRR